MPPTITPTIALHVTDWSYRDDLLIFSICVPIALMHWNTYKQIKSPIRSEFPCTTATQGIELANRQKKNPIKFTKLAFTNLAQLVWFNFRNWALFKYENYKITSTITHPSSPFSHSEGRHCVCVAFIIIAITLVSRFQLIISLISTHTRLVSLPEARARRPM